MSTSRLTNRLLSSHILPSRISYQVAHTVNTTYRMFSRSYNAMEALPAFENVNLKSRNETICFRDRSLPTLPYNRPYRSDYEG
jgi:hypothetical protein